MKRCSTSLVIKRNANQNCSELSPHTSQNDHCQKNLQIINAGEGVQKRESSYSVGRNVNRCSHYGEQWRFPKRLKRELPYYSTPGHVPQENCDSKRYMLPNVHCNTIYNSQYMAATCMSINRGMDKDEVVHIYNGILFNQKEERNCAICRHVDGPRDCHTQ